MDPKTMNQTFMPKQLIRKTVFNTQNNLTNNSFEKTGGNIYIQIQPQQIKFEGYQLDTKHTANIKVINKAPIPQRIHVLPLQKSSSFSLKVNKKGPISSGMSENIVVEFKSKEYKYQNDFIRINTQTENFVIPVHANPSIPNIRSIFPQIIDFGSIDVNQSESNIYPIVNPIPLNFGYEFIYDQQSSGFMITPLKGSIEANSTQNIQITFLPTDKTTYVAEVSLYIQQLHFQPIRIKIMGNGRDKKGAFQTTKRAKSSKLNPIKQESKVPDAFDESLIANKTQNIPQKKSFIRSKASFPKLFRKTLQGTSQVDEQKPAQSLKNIGEREYLSRYSKVQQLDKEKQVKFAEFLGDRAMTEEEIEFDKKIQEEYRNTRIRNKILQCESRYEPVLENDAEVQYQLFSKKETTWDDNKNDELKQRKERLQLFMKAGSKVIEKYRLEKRLQKIKIFLQGCKTRKQVAKKVEEDYNKSLDMAKSNTKNLKFVADFTLDNLAPASFPLQFKQTSESIKKTFETSGKPEFDDNLPLPQIKSHQTDEVNFNNSTYPSDFFHFDKMVPSQRKSGEEQYPLKTAALPEYSLPPLSSVYSLPLKIPSHHFIYNDFNIRRYKNLQYIDEKDPDYLIDSSVKDIEDEFQGWSKGDMQVLKAKFQRNMGCEFTSISHFSSLFKDTKYVSELGNHLPKEIDKKEIEKDDIIDEGDSDEEKDPAVLGEKADQYIEKIEQNNKKVQERREKKMENYEKELLEVVDRNLEVVKLNKISTSTGKIRELNKWSQQNVNRILI